MAKEKAKSLVDMIKDKIKKGNSGGSVGNTFYLKDGMKKRVRFVSDFEDGIPVLFHSKWGDFNTPCLKYYGQKCPHCNSKDKDVKHVESYAWTVYNHEDKKRQLFIYKANQFSPVPDMIAFYESYGTLLDRDYVISKIGEKLATSYTTVPMDKERFKKKDIEAFTNKEIFEMLKAIYGQDMDLKDEDIDDEDEDEIDDDEEDEIPFDADEDDDEEEVKPKKKAKKEEPKKKEKSKQKKKVDDDDDDDDDGYFEDDEEEEEEVKPKKKKGKK
jgi:hypothetical protein